MDGEGYAVASNDEDRIGILYRYDALNQLNKVQYPSYTEELYYDRAGNRTRRTAKGVEELYKYDPRNRLTGYTKGGVKTQFTYDKAGNLLKDDKAKYTYDAFNRMERAETFDGHVQINRYDAEGLRHEMEEDGKLVQFIFRGDEVIAEEKDSSVIRYIRGYDLIASDAERARTYYHYASDEMSSITHIVGEDHVLNRYEYDAWGNTAVCEETVENRFRFNGQQYDSITQQYYLRARFYNPVIARFTQEDTYRGDGLNLYTYCANNPVYYEDPSGHVADCVKEAYKEYRKQGMSPQMALDKANYDRFYQKNLRKSMSATDAAQRAQVDSEVNKAMQKYQMLVNVMDIDPTNKDNRPWVHGTKVHKAVHDEMNEWVSQQGFKAIYVYTEIYYYKGEKDQLSKECSRMDLVIKENNGYNSKANTNKYYIGDIKTGKSQGGSTYGWKQMTKNQNNILRNKAPNQNRPDVTHWQFNPGKSKPQRNLF